jgi:hypothetical protein
MNLQRLELQILQLHNSLSMRPTLDVAVKLGERLAEAKGQLPHKEWTPWLARVGLKLRMAQLYMEIAREEPPPGTIGINKFLAIVRAARRRAAKGRIAETRAGAIASGAGVTPGYKVVEADCRRYHWPRPLDVIATDPPWADLSAYRWLSKFAADRLKPGGLVLVHVSQHHLLREMRAMAGSLRYVWTLAMGFSKMQGDGPINFCPFAVGWRPVQVWCNGQFSGRKYESLSDSYALHPPGKIWHEHEQPLAPWTYWLGRLTLPREQVADPFCGSGTIGVALRDIGGRRYIGTDISADNVKVAMARLRT